MPHPVAGTVSRSDLKQRVQRPGRMAAMVASAADRHRRLRHERELHGRSDANHAVHGITMSPTRVLDEAVARIRMSRQLSRRLDEAAVVLAARTHRPAAPVPSPLATGEAILLAALAGAGSTPHTVLTGDRAA